MNDSDQQRADDEAGRPPERPGGEPKNGRKPGDVISMCLLAAVVGSIFSWMLAWGLGMPVFGQAIGAGVGAVLMAMIVVVGEATLGRLERRGRRQSCDAFRWATEDPEAPKSLGKAVKTAADTLLSDMLSARAAARQWTKERVMWREETVVSAVCTERGW